MLEELHFDTSGIWYDEEEAGHFFGDGDWALPLLKVLVFYYNDVIIQGIFSCHFYLCLILFFST